MTARYRTVATIAHTYDVYVQGVTAWLDVSRSEAARFLRTARNLGQVVTVEHTATRQEWREEIAPQCVNTGCTRDAAYDSEPPAGGYFSTCERCHTIPAAGLHAHRHSYSAAQCAANGYDPAHTWLTSSILRPVVTDDVITAWECREYLPGGRGRCGYVISAAEMDAHQAYRRGEAFLCNTAHAASFGHGIGPQTNGHEVWAAFNIMRDAYNAQHPTDVR